MKYQVLFSVLVIPTELSKLFQEILKDPEYHLNYLDIYGITTEDGFNYFRFNNSCDDIQDLEYALDDNWFPFNYYPSSLDDVVIFNRFDEKGMFIGTSFNYSSYLEVKLYGEKSRYSELFKENMAKEYKWENQVDNCLSNRLLKLL